MMGNGCSMERAGDSVGAPSLSHLGPACLLQSPVAVVLEVRERKAQRTRSDVGDGQWAWRGESWRHPVLIQCNFAAVTRLLSIGSRRSRSLECLNRAEHHHLRVRIVCCYKVQMISTTTHRRTPAAYVVAEVRLPPEEAAQVGVVLNTLWLVVQEKDCRGGELHAGSARKDRQSRERRGA